MSECEIKWESRYKWANEQHLEIGCRGTNPFQASGLLAYECDSGNMYTGGMLETRTGGFLIRYRTDQWSCSFQLTFVEPLSHSILYSLVRGFLELICYAANGFVVDGRKFSLPPELQDRMDIFADKIEYPSAFNRRPPKLRRHAPAPPLLPPRSMLHLISVNACNCNYFHLSAWQSPWCSAGVSQSRNGCSRSSIPSLRLLEPFLSTWPERRCILSF